MLRSRSRARRAHCSTCWRAARARKAIVEFGTSFGISTLHLAAALARQWRRPPDHQRVRAVQGRRGHGTTSRPAGSIDLVEIREGDALKTLSADLPDTIDLAAARRRQGALPGDPGSGRRPSQARARSSSPTMPTTAPTISRAYAGPQAATCPRPSPKTSSSPCGSASAA